MDWPEIEIAEPIREIVIEKRIDPFQLIAESYPRIKTRISSLWGSQELADQFNRWIFVDQDGRKGFPKDVIEALISISNQHEFETGRVGSIIKRDFHDRW